MLAGGTNDRLTPGSTSCVAIHMAMPLTCRISARPEPTPSMRPSSVFATGGLGSEHSVAPDFRDRRVRERAPVDGSQPRCDLWIVGFHGSWAGLPTP